MAEHTPVLLLTRFSWPHPFWKDRSEAEYQAWLAARLILLRDYPVRSLRNAWKKPDMWLVLAQDHGEKFNAALCSAIAAAETPYKILLYAGTEIKNTVSDYLTASPFAGISRICTVRLDSDDLLAADYFARIETALGKVKNEQCDLGLSFPGGCILDVGRKKIYYSCYPDNPFIGLVETPNPDGSIATVFRKMHTELMQDVPRALYLRSNQPVWCSVVHGGNVANQSLLEGNLTPLADLAGLLRRFGH